jgi:P-type E1-E2 ATPase
LRVLARATAEDKFILVSGIRGKSGIVGMTGEGITDAKALQCAQVGLCMGSGCDVAKDSADLVIRDNKF